VPSALQTKWLASQSRPVEVHSSQTLQRVKLDVPHDREHVITDTERQAYARLVAERAQRGGGVTIVEPLVRTESTHAAGTRVRPFTWPVRQTARR
jgi:hypothetical protein